MSAPRFFVRGPLAGCGAGGEVPLPEHVARQVATVLRMRPGDPVVLFDGAGGEWRAALAAVGRGSATARLLAYDVPGREPALRLTLCQALLKADRFEWVIQKGTELGVAEFVPLVTRRVVAADRVGAAGGPAASESKLARWRRIAVEAAEQSGRLAVPLVHPPRSLEAALESRAPRLVCWEDERRLPFPAALGEVVGGGSNEVAVFVGPEGGFTPEEVQAATAAGARAASLGPRILRSETAAVVAAALALLGSPAALDAPAGTE